MATAAVPNLDATTLAEFCRRHGIARLALFGSRVRGTARPDSDLDLLVEFLPGRKVSLFDVGGMISELTERLGVQVDLRTAGDLSPLFREQVLREAETLYAAA
jgi:predicted nucleotidyltransferase